MEKKIDTILSELRDLSTRFNALHGKVEDLWKYGNMDDYAAFPPLVHSKSPITINTLGQSILTQYKGSDIVDKLEEELIAEIEKRGLKTALDVQVFTEKLIQSRFNTDEFNNIKNQIYFHPAWENQPVNIKVLSMLMGLYLRDKYLDRHPELIPESVI